MFEAPSGAFERKCRGPSWDLLTKEKTHFALDSEGVRQQVLAGEFVSGTEFKVNGFFVEDIYEDQ